MSPPEVLEMSHGAGTEVSISERRRAARCNPCYGLFQASTEAFSLLSVVSLEVASARNLQRGQAKHSDSELVHTVLLDLWIEKTQAILRVAEHQAGRPETKGMWFMCTRMRARSWWGWWWSLSTLMMIPQVALWGWVCRFGRWLQPA